MRLRAIKLKRLCARRYRAFLSRIPGDVYAAPLPPRPPAVLPISVTSSSSLSGLHSLTVSNTIVFGSAAVHGLKLAPGLPVFAKLTHAPATLSCSASATGPPPVARAMCGSFTLWNANAISEQWNDVIPPFTGYSHANRQFHTGVLLRSSFHDRVCFTVGRDPLAKYRTSCTFFRGNAFRNSSTTCTFF